MKKNYIRPVVEIEDFVTEEIMDNFNPENLPSYNGNLGYYQDDAGYISFHTGDDNVLTGIDYTTFNH